jgi:hypothetical protein
VHHVGRQGVGRVWDSDAGEVAGGEGEGGRIGGRGGGLPAKRPVAGGILKERPLLSRSGLGHGVGVYLRSRHWTEGWPSRHV